MKTFKLETLYQQTKENNNFLIQHDENKSAIVSHTPINQLRTIFLKYENNITVQFINPLFIAKIIEINQENYYLQAFYCYQNKNELHPILKSHNNGEFCMPIQAYLNLNPSPKKAFLDAYQIFLQSAFLSTYRKNINIIYSLPEPTLRMFAKLPNHQQMIKLALEKQYEYQTTPR